MNRSQIQNWLREDDPGRLSSLWTQADTIRRDNVGDEVHLRGLIEISNYCVRNCAYCGIRAGNKHVERYRMEKHEILACAQHAVELGYGTIVLQSGEDPTIIGQWMTDLVRSIKRQTSLAVTLSLGECSEAELASWRGAGADRYLLRFETSNRDLYEWIHPSLPARRSDRFQILKQLQELGYETGSGLMIGLPSQTYEDLANDIALFAELGLDMIGVGPFIAHPETPLGQAFVKSTFSLGNSINADNQVPNTELMTYKVLALTRIVCPQTNIPSTTALGTVNKKGGRLLGLQRGANVIMPNMTPMEYRRKYEIYPAKVCCEEPVEEYHRQLLLALAEINRRAGTGRGDSPLYLMSKHSRSIN
jgi:biotin synthase